MSPEELKSFQLDTCKASLEEYKQRCHDLSRENERLKHEREVQEEEAREIISFLRRNAESKDATIEQVKDALEKQEQAARDDQDRVAAAHAAQVKELEGIARVREQQLENELTEVQIELESLKRFKDQKAAIEAELEDMRRGRAEQEEGNKETIAQMERKFFEEKAKLQREAKQMLAEIKKSSQEEAVERLDASTKKILFENRRMATELRLQIQEADELQKLSRARDEENKRLRRDVDLQEQSGKEYAKQRYKHTREIKDLLEKVKSLERSLGDVVKGQETVVQNMRADHEKRTKELTTELSGLKQHIKLKAKELANVKRLAQLILEKRNDVETFLLESLEEVKVSFAREQSPRRRPCRRSVSL